MEHNSLKKMNNKKMKYVTFILTIIMAVTHLAYSNYSVNEMDLQLQPFIRQDSSTGNGYEIESITLLKTVDPSVGLGPINNYEIISHRLVAMKLLDLTPISSDPSASKVVIMKKPLFYPSPFKLSEGSTLFVQTEEGNSGKIEFRVYDMMGNEIYRSESKPVNNNLKNITKFTFNIQKLGHDNMPAGIYFYLVIQDGEVLKDSNGNSIAKGKFAILP